MRINDLIDQHNVVNAGEKKTKTFRRNEKNRIHKALKIFEKALIEELEWKADASYLLKIPQKITFEANLDTRSSRLDASCYEKQEYIVQVVPIYNGQSAAIEHKITRDIMSTQHKGKFRLSVVGPNMGRRGIIGGLHKLAIVKWLLDRNEKLKMTDEKATEIILSKLVLLNLSASEMEALEMVKRRIKNEIPS